MTDFENKDLQPETTVPETAEAAEPAQTTEEVTQPAAAEAPVAEPAQEAPVQAASPAPETVSTRPTPQLTLEPDPVVPEILTPEEANIPGSAAEPFHMPDPPRAPEPPKAEPAYQQTPPNYTAQQPQYSTPPQYNPQPQYGTPNYGQPMGQTYYNVPPTGYNQKSRLAAGLLAFLVGVFGVHNFYLGFNSRAVVQLIVSTLGGIFTCGVATAGVAIWALIEGILILSANSPSRMYDGNGVILKD